MTEPGDTKKDWEHLINHLSSTLTEIKNLLGETKRTLRLAQWTQFVAVLAVLIAVLTLAATVVVPVVVK